MNSGPYCHSTSSLLSSFRKSSLFTIFRLWVINPTFIPSFFFFFLIQGYPILSVILLPPYSVNLWHKIGTGHLWYGHLYLSFFWAWCSFSLSKSLDFSKPLPMSYVFRSLQQLFMLEIRKLNHNDVEWTETRDRLEVVHSLSSFSQRTGCSHQRICFSSTAQILLTANRLFWQA